MSATIQSPIADPHTVGCLQAALSILRWCIANPEWRDGRRVMSGAIHPAMAIVEKAIGDAAEDDVDCNRVANHAAFITGELFLAGVRERIRAIEHLLPLNDLVATELIVTVDDQLREALDRLSTFSSPAS